MKVRVSYTVRGESFEEFQTLGGEDSRLLTLGEAPGRSRTVVAALDDVPAMGW